MNTSRKNTLSNNFAQVLEPYHSHIARADCWNQDDGEYRE